MRKAVFMHCPELERYHYPPEHPFNISRAKGVRKIANSMGLLSGRGRSEIAPEPAEKSFLEKFHSARYLEALEAAAKGKFEAEALPMGLGTPDCPVFEDMYEYSVMATAATLTGANLIISGETDVAFNPSGGFHHAAAERASGFCYINDMVLGCMRLAEAGKKVLYLDVDVHHGDGVAYAFYERADVMTISFHQNPGTLFPGTGFADEIGRGAGKGYCVNVPLPIGTYDQPYLKAFEALALPLIAAYGPDVIVFELGADALAGDPLAQLYLTNNVYVEVINHLLSIEKPILTTGGGGYDIDNTVRAWALAWAVLCGAENTEQLSSLRDNELTVSNRLKDTIIPAVEAIIEAVKANLFRTHRL